MARQWWIPVVTLAVVAGSATAAGAASASPALPHALPAPVVSPGHPMVWPGGSAVPSARSSPNASAKSANWSGYAAAHGTYHSVSASWIEPTAHCTSGSKYAAFWVGFDGFSSGSVEQTGTDSDCHGKTAAYYGWYEIFPAAAVIFHTKVKPGDHMSASVTFSGTDAYTLVLDDATRHWSHTITKHEPGLSRSSAEVITEAPSTRNGVQALADFGTVDFTSAKANGISLRKLHPTEILMTDGSGQLKDSTSSISRTGAFHDTWIRSN
jgi:Peptidase A4 family